MGASDWDHFTPWQKNVEAAMDSLKAKTAADMGMSELQAIMMIDQGGTNSILDIVVGASPTPYDLRSPHDLLMAFAAPESWLIETYRTTRPTRKMVEETMPYLFERVERGTAIYFAVWNNVDDPGDPAWWYFYGCSGD